MNVDEAMKVARREVLGWYDDMHTAGPVLADEVQRLRAELAEAKAESVGLGESHDRLAAALAAAKAASVPPVKFCWYYESNECDIIINGMNDEESTRFGNWLDDRMKERG